MGRLAPIVVAIVLVVVEERIEDEKADEADSKPEVWHVSLAASVWYGTPLVPFYRVGLEGVFQCSPDIPEEAFELGAFDGALTEALTEGFQVELDPFAEFGIRNAGAGKVGRLAGRLFELIPGAYVLAHVAAEDPVTDAGL